MVCFVMQIKMKRLKLNSKKITPTYNLKRSFSALLRNNSVYVYVCLCIYCRTHYTSTYICIFFK